MSTTPNQDGVKPSPILLANEDAGEWVTIHHCHVHIDGDGKVDRGPAHLVGKRKAEIADRITARHGVNHPDTGTPEGPENDPGLYTEETKPKATAGYMLASDSEMTPAVTLGLGLPAEHNELPVHYRWQRATVSGDYTHPITGDAVHIDKPRVQRWVNNVKLMLSRKIDVPVSTSHKGYKDARNTLGNIFDARERDGELELLAGYYGDDSLNIARKNKVSIGVESYQDAFGNVYPETITHLAVTPVPVLPGLPGFVTLSRGEPTDADLPTLAPTQQKGVEMLDTKHKDRVTQYLGGTDIPEDTNEVIALLLGKLDAAPKPEAVTQLSQELEDTKAKVLELSREDDDTPADPRIAGLQYRAAKADVGALVSEGVISKASGKLLLSLVESGEGKPNTLLLSREDDSAGISFDKVLNVVRELRAGKPSGEVTGEQTTLLSREVPDATAEKTKADEAEQVRATLAQTSLGRRALAAQAK